MQIYVRYLTSLGYIAGRLWRVEFISSRHKFYSVGGNDDFVVFR